MNLTVIVAGWWIGGVIGSYLVWYDLTRSLYPQRSRCPTPRSVLLMFIGGFAGYCILLAGLLLRILHWIEANSSDYNSTWWSSPMKICRKDEER